MNTTLPPLIALAVFACSFSANAQLLNPQQESVVIPIDQYLASVNGRVITASDVLSILQPMQASIAANTPEAELAAKMKEVYTRVLDQLVENALILEEFNKAGGQLPDAMVEDRIREIIRQKFAGDDSGLLRTLQSEGRTLEQFRAELRDDLIVSSLRREQVDRFSSVSLGDVIQEYERRKEAFTRPAQVRIRLIQFKGGDDPEAANTRMATLLNELRNGRDFAEAARELTEGPRKDSGGDLGTLAYADLRTEFKRAIEALKPGQISGPISFDGDWGVIKLEEKQEESITPLRDVQKSIESELRMQNEKRLYDTWIQRLKEKHHVIRY
jgi:peptidyl-prolyl cis-trans isomerase SurA